MHLEILTEDKSGGVVVESLIRQMVSAIQPEFSVSIRPHRGKGEIPDDPMQKPGRFASGLLDLLPAKLRAYDHIYAGTPFTIVVIMDADSLPFSQVHDLLQTMAEQYAPGLVHVIGVCVEETESWLLGDQEAIMKAYPEADLDVLTEYQQDSVCGTWEILCHALLRERAPALIRIGYPAIGQLKNEWASNISVYMDPARNVSPSFHAFSKELIRALRQTRRAHV